MTQRLADFFNLIFGFRKFLAWFSLFVVAIIFRHVNYIDGGQFVDLLKATFAGFVAGNGVEHIVSVTKEYFNSKGQKTEDLGENLVTAYEPDTEVKK